MSKITAWRITKPKYVSSAFEGEGARRFPGRWNSRGTAMVYTASTQSLAMLEMLVHLEQEEILFGSYAVIPVTFDSTQVTSLAPSDLPAEWRENLPPDSSRAVGDQWVSGQTSLVLAVPSIVVPSELNFLINPQHPDFSSLDIREAEPLLFDDRLTSD